MHSSIKDLFKIIHTSPSYATYSNICKELDVCCADAKRRFISEDYLKNNDSEDYLKINDLLYEVYEIIQPKEDHLANFLYKAKIHTKGT